jgi:hypothetical protein
MVRPLEDYNYRLMTPAGEVLEANTCVGISEAVRSLVAKTGVQWSYQVVHRALRLTGVWVAAYRLPGSSSARPVVALIERAPTAANHAPPP